MKLLLSRDWPLLTRTIGRLYCDEAWISYTGEDRLRYDKKVYGTTAIPAGIYVIVLDFSNRFQCIMPHILDVQGFDGIRIHGGNTEKDTLGCPMVGMEHDAEGIYKCKPAVDKVIALLKLAAGRKEKATIEIPEVIHTPIEE